MAVPAMAPGTDASTTTPMTPPPTLPMPAIRRYGWLPRVGLAAFASVTIVAYLVIGPYFTLGWVTKGIELAIVLLVIADLLIWTDTGRATRLPPRSA